MADDESRLGVERLRRDIETHGLHITARTDRIGDIPRERLRTFPLLIIPAAVAVPAIMLAAALPERLLWARGALGALVLVILVVCTTLTWFVNRGGRFARLVPPQLRDEMRREHQAGERAP